MILLGDEFAFLTYVSHEGGSVAIPQEGSPEQLLAKILTTLLLLQNAGERLAITPRGRHALATGEVREGVSTRYVQIPDLFEVASGTLKQENAKQENAKPGNSQQGDAMARRDDSLPA